MKEVRPVIVARFRVACCDVDETWEFEYEAEEVLCDHIEARHPDLFKKLQARGRVMAQSQNGLGYYDDGKSKSGGWHKAQPSFRKSWTRKAVRELASK